MVEVAVSKVRMADITGDEARALYPTNPVILLPMGSHEDQGPHAPMGDYSLAEKMAELIALRATAEGTRTVVAPVLPFGKGDFFGPMIGGIALSAATFRALLDELFRELLRHKLTKLVVINGHGGNVNVINEATRAVMHAGGPVIPALYLWRIAYAEMPKLLGAEKAKALTPEAIGDYVAGPNHVLPTGRRARFSSGLSVLDFMKRTSFIELDETSLKAIGPAAVALAEAEGLPAHARSVDVGLK
ncbi:creatininase family protein [Leptolyngbya sp. 15MV]|nr:creatininase family protein [Leptolyngbya sp. 15MV]